MVNKAIFQRTSKTRADKKVVIKQLLFAANQVALRAIESSMLFAVFRPLRIPVPNGQSSHI
jgi:hypothetical protein